MRGCLQLLVVHGQQVRLCLLDVEEHLFAQLLSLFYPIELLLVDLLQSETLLVLQPLLKISRFTFHLVLLLKESLGGLLLGPNLVFLHGVVFEDLCFVGAELGDLLFVARFHIFQALL